MLCDLLIGLVFSMAANERRRELGVLRALGPRAASCFQSLVAEAGLLALGGGVAGIALTLLVDLPVPPADRGHPGHALSAALAAGRWPLRWRGGLVIALGSVTLAALLPAYRISHQDPAIAMRE